MQNRHKNKPDKNKLIYDMFLIRDSFYKKPDKLFSANYENEKSSKSTN